MRSSPLFLGLAVTAALTLSACGRHEAATGASAQADASAARQYMAKNAKAPGVVSLPSGLQYKIIHSGPANGQQPVKGDEIKLNYTGSLIDGQVFDSTTSSGQPAVMKLDNLVPGWMEALPKMRPGDEWLLFLPPSLGYGPDGHPPVIPQNSVLVFDVTLLGVLKTGESVKFAGVAGAQHGVAEISPQHHANT
ncbi:MAG: FKBP-type peptidyl-prolyl cis-trans isomerase [Caulobacteraceae bacterium]